jgi:hypothetical protein
VSRLVFKTSVGSEQGPGWVRLPCISAKAPQAAVIIRLYRSAVTPEAHMRRRIGCGGRENWTCTQFSDSSIIGVYEGGTEGKRRAQTVAIEARQA